MVTVHLTEKQAEVAYQAVRALPAFALQDGVMLVGEAARTVESTERVFECALRDHRTRTGFEALGVPESSQVAS